MGVTFIGYIMLMNKGFLTEQQTQKETSDSISSSGIYEP